MSEKKKIKILDNTKDLLSKKSYLQNLIFHWQQKIVYNQESNKMIIKRIELVFEKLLLKNATHFLKGKLKTWIGNKTHEKIIEINLKEKEK